MFGKYWSRSRFMLLTAGLVSAVSIWGCSGGSSSPNASSSSSASGSSSSTIVQNELNALNATLNASENSALTNIDIQGLAASRVLEDGDADALALLSKQ